MGLKHCERGASQPSLLCYARISYRYMLSCYSSLLDSIKYCSYSFDLHFPVLPFDKTALCEAGMGRSPSPGMWRVFCRQTPALSC